MALDAMEVVVRTEAECRERKAAAEMGARQRLADAEREGTELLHRMRADAAAQGKEFLRLAEERAAEKAAEINRTAAAEADALRLAAGERLEDAAGYIVGRVVRR